MTQQEAKLPEEKLPEGKPPKTRKQKIKKIALIVLLVLVYLICTLLLIGVALFHRYYSLLDYQSVDTSIPKLTEEEISSVLSELYGDEPLQPEESEMEEDSRQALDTSMEQVLVSTPAEESEEPEDLPSEEPSQAPSKAPEQEPDEEEPELSHVLVIGMDVSGINTRARSDTMIVVTINETTGKIVLTSLLRDLYVSIPEYPNNRLNAAFALGNVALLEKTIYANFGIAIDRYIAIDFNAFTEIIDILGGIELTLTEEDLPHVFPGEAKEPGVHTLSGELALRYARWRRGASDFERTERQRTVMTTVINRMLGMSFSELLAVMETILPQVRTDLTEGDCLSILFSVGSLRHYAMQTQRIPFPGTWEYATVDRKSVLTLDLEENRRQFFESVK